MKRDFKGVWIPAEIWLDESLSVMEKLFLVEIDSLDNDDGCFASNKYFSEFFGISTRQCSTIISNLIAKKFIFKHNEDYGNVVNMRVLTANDHGLSRVEENFVGGRKKTSRGGGRKLLPNNTINNTSNKNKLTFEDFYSKYPKKTDKKKAMQKWNNLSAVKRKDAIAGIDAFVDGKESKYICSPTVYLNGERWEDEGTTDVGGYANEWGNMK